MRNCRLAASFLSRLFSTGRCLNRVNGFTQISREEGRREGYRNQNYSDGNDEVAFPLRSSPTLRRIDRPRTLSVVPPEKDLPYYKFEELLRKRLTFLTSGSSRFEDILKAHGSGAKNMRLTNTYKDLLLSQPASSYAGGPRSGKAAMEWQPRSDVPTLDKLKVSYETQGLKGLEDLIVSKFSLFVSLSMLSPEDIEALKGIANLSRPAEWYPVARSIPRKLHLHVGPTNSGKTYHALQKLQKAETGCFAGPLRLLAHEIYDRFNKAGVRCNLVTGEERRVDETVMLTSSTIEMLNTGVEVDVLVIDEIQMIADPDRGSAWTQALLGCPAKEIHMCGEASVVDLVKGIAETLGETVEVHNYDRLGALQPLNESLGGTFKDIQEGDAVVTFSRQNIFNVKKSIEEITGKKCAVVYGGLPPETRAAQARLFNDPESDFGVMVASDAIGMGLNLSIKRVIFESLSKWTGKEIQKLPVPQVKQIAGRAGRFKPKSKVDVLGSDPVKDVPGYVTTLRDDDLAYLHESLSTPTIQLKRASIRAPVELMENFVRRYPPSVKLSLVMQQFQAMAETSDFYAVQDLAPGAAALDILHGIKGLSFADTWSFVDAPLKLRDPKCVKAYVQMATALGDGKRVEILDMEDVDVDLLDKGVPETQERLAKLESLHAQLTLYLWLAGRFPGSFVSLSEVFQLKLATEELIESALELLKAKRLAGGKANSSRQFISQQMAYDMYKRRTTSSFGGGGGSRKSRREDDDDEDDTRQRRRPRHS